MDTIGRDMPSRIRLSIFPDRELAFNDALYTTYSKIKVSDYYVCVYQHTSVPNSRNPFEKKSLANK